MNTHSKIRRARWFWFSLLCGAAMLLAGAQAAVAGTMGEPAHKVVIQVSTKDPTVQRIALNNAANVQKGLGMDNVQVEIVAYGPGLSLLTKQSKYSERVASMSLQNIKFSACENTIAGIKRKTGKEPDLTEGVGTVPSGVVRIMELQQAGYSYVRP